MDTFRLEQHALQLGCENEKLKEDLAIEKRNFNDLLRGLRIKCSTCLGDGWVHYHGQSEETCPVCKGRKTVKNG